MKVELTPGAVLALAGLAVGGVVVWRVYKAAGEALAGPAQAAADAAASLYRAYDWMATARPADEWDKPSVNLAGLPPPEDVSGDPATARWVIDRHGYMTASKWFTATALLRAAWMDNGTGTPPPRGSAMFAELGTSAIDYGTGTGW